MKLATIVVGAVAIVAAQPALACRGPFSHQYVLLETPPQRLPAGAVLLQVRVAPEAFFKGERYAKSVTARITHARDLRLIGKSIDIQPEIFSSCGHWRESEQANYVIGFVVRRRDSLMMVPVTYRSKQYRTPAQDNSEGITRPLRLDRK
jgi:hypothetical protein